MKLPKIAIFCRDNDKKAIDIIKYFLKKNYPISLVLIETQIPKKKYSPKVITWEKSRIRNKPNFFFKIFKKIIVSIKATDLILKLFPYNQYLNIYSVYNWCKKNNIKVKKVLKHSSKETKKILEKYKIEYVLHSSSNYLIKEPLLSMEQTKIINAHCAKLPEHRSLDALPWSILMNDSIGITTHFIDEGIDTGDILKFYPVKLLKNDDLISLRLRIEKKVSEVFYDTVIGLQNNEIITKPQDKNTGFYHKPMIEEEFEKAEKQLKNRIREIYNK